MLWFLTFLDFIVLIIIALAQFNLSSEVALLLLAAFYLFIKGLIFLGDFFSVLDLVAAFYLVLLIFGIKFFLGYLIMFYLIYKVLLSFS